MAQTNTGALLGRTLGHYSLTVLLGVGGMAEVYRARDTRLRREVAVKVLPPTLAADPAYVARFRSEAQRVAALGHPNIVPVYEFGEHDGLLYLVMPLAPHSLRDRLLARGGSVPLPIADALAVAIQVASALEAAHAQGIVHRDVKPENILLDRDGHALLTDFGIARELAFLRRAGAVQTLAATGLPVGTPEYMAPEQLRNGPIDQRADVYALGAVLYELLCGVAPHEAGTPYEVAALALTTPITPPALRNPRVWPELEAVVLTALAPNPSDRFSGMAEFAVALRAASKRNTGLRGGVRATLPIFRKTAIVDPYEGPTREVLIYDGSTGLPIPLPQDGRGRRNNHGGRGARLPRSVAGPLRRKRLVSIVAALLLAAVVAVSGFAILRTINTPNENPNGGLGAFNFPTSTAIATTAPTVTTAPTATATATPVPTGTPLPTATPTPVPPSLSFAPSSWLLGRNKTICSSTTSQTITNTGTNAVSWTWLPPSPAYPGMFEWRQHGTTTWRGGSPNQSSLGSGTPFQLDVLMSCPTGPTVTYTIPVLVTDLVTNTSHQESFSLITPHS